MNIKTNPRNGFIHLYNPKEEGLGNYDINYINANKKIKKQSQNQNQNQNETYERYAA